MGFTCHSSLNDFSCLLCRSLDKIVFAQKHEYLICVHNLSWCKCNRSQRHLNAILLNQIEKRCLRDQKKWLYHYFVWSFICQMGEHLIKFIIVFTKLFELAMLFSVGLKILQTKKDQVKVLTFIITAQLLKAASRLICWCDILGGGEEKTNLPNFSFSIYDYLGCWVGIRC